MRSCDGIFSANRVNALLAQQEMGSQVRSLVKKKHERFSSARSRTFFGGGAKFSRQPLDNTCTASSEKLKKVFGASKISTEAVENFWIT
jgi:hypothetical protein